MAGMKEPHTTPPSSLTYFLISSLVLLRSLIGFHPHSGQGNNHGNEAAYGGDFEAQRHWMELTLHLPISSWYHYDLDYWGLDYPPLTAYVSYICGYFSKILVGPESVSLFDSRGIEDPLHKSFMRATVLVLDIAIYFPAVWVIAKRLCSGSSQKFLTILAFALTQPAIVLIDHGHFQYNTVALGLALWSFHFMTKGSGFQNCVWGSFLFCMSLNFKQMTLYYAPAVFMYLLGRCFAAKKEWLVRFFVLGGTVIFSFGILWWPFFVYPYTDDETGVKLSSIETVLHVLKRLFPFQRGLFEGKVSNLWCALSTKPISIRSRIPEHLQPKLALMATLLLLLPLCVRLLQKGLESKSNIPPKSNDNDESKGTKDNQEHDLKLLLWGTSASGLSFFLASFQVHEKSILMAVAPISLLFFENPLFVSWFCIVASWTLWPLITVDELRSAYILSNVIFLVLLWSFSKFDTTRNPFETISWSGVIPTLTHNLVFPISLLFLLGLHFAELVFVPPTKLPDLFPVLWSVVGCGLFCWSWISISHVLLIESRQKDFISRTDKNS